MEEFVGDCTFRPNDAHHAIDQLAAAFLTSPAYLLTERPGGSTSTHEHDGTPDAPDASSLQREFRWKEDVQAFGGRVSQTREFSVVTQNVEELHECVPLRRGIT